eukprot:260311_1
MFRYFTCEKSQFYFQHQIVYYSINLIYYVPLDFAFYYPIKTLEENSKYYMRSDNLEMYIYVNIDPVISISCEIYSCSLYSISPDYNLMLYSRWWSSISSNTNSVQYNGIQLVVC